MTRRIAVLACLLSASGCYFDAAPFQLTMDTVPGTYAATLFSSSTTDGVVHDLLRAGATLSLTLGRNGMTTGRLFVPGGNEDGSDVDVCLPGTWALDGFQVTWTQGADTFLGDMTFAVSKEELHGDETFGSTRIRLKLQRTRAAPIWRCLEPR